jgi:hypothetical protein
MHGISPLGPGHKKLRRSCQFALGFAKKAR